MNFTTLGRENGSYQAPTFTCYSFGVFRSEKVKCSLREAVIVVGALSAVRVSKVVVQM